MNERKYVDAGDNKQQQSSRRLLTNNGNNVKEKLVSRKYFIVKVINQNE